MQQNFTNTDDISFLRIVRLLRLILQTTTDQLFDLSRAERLTSAFLMRTPFFSFSLLPPGLGPHIALSENHPGQLDAY